MTEDKGSDGDMRKFLAVLALVVLGGALFFYTRSTMQEPKQEQQVEAPATEKSGEEFKEIAAIDFDNKYPETMGEVMGYYNQFMKYTYKTRNEKELKHFMENELETVLKQQRKLYDEDLLAVNTFEQQLDAVKKELISYNEKNIAIIDSKMNSPEIMPSKDDEDRRLAKVKVLYYTTVNDNIYMEFGLRENEGGWKVVGFKAIEAFKLEE